MALSTADAINDLGTIGAILLQSTFDACPMQLLAQLQRKDAMIEADLYAKILGVCSIFAAWQLHTVGAFLFYPRGGSIGYLAAVAMPLDLPQRNVYVAFNFEANYGVPPNTTYLEWVDRWNIAQNKFGIGNNVTGIDGRHHRESQRHHRYTRNAFYQSFIGYANGFGFNGSACLLRTICEVAASNLDEHNGLLGSIFKILFMPSTSAPELNVNITYRKDSGNGAEEPTEAEILDTHEHYRAEYQGLKNANCTPFLDNCPQGILDVISEWI